MEILDSTESFLHWDRNLSELSEAEDIDSMLYTNVSYGSVVIDPSGGGRGVEWPLGGEPSAGSHLKGQGGTRLSIQSPEPWGPGIFPILEIHL